jgi:O-antigen ligase
VAKSGKRSPRKGASAKARAKSQSAPAHRSTSPAPRDEMSAAQRVAWISLHVLVFAVPVAIGNWTWLPGLTLPFSFDQFDIVKVVVQRGVTLVAFAAWAYHILVNGGSVRRTKVDYLILAVLGWIALSTVFSVHVPTAVFGKYRRFEGLISFVNYAFIYFLAVQFLDRLSRIRSLARTLFFSSVVVSLYGVAQYVGIDPLTWGRLPFEANRAFSTYGNPNLLGGFLVMVLPVALALALSEKDQRWRIAYWVGFLLATLCWIVAFTRGAWIAGAVALLILGVAAWRMRTRLTAVDWSFAAGIAALSAVVVVRSLAVQNDVMNVWNRLSSILEFGQGSALTRFQIWDAAWRATLERPVFGFGPDTFRLIFPGFKPVEYVAAAGHASVADNVHNYPLQLMAAVGIPGMLLLYGLFITVGVLSFRTAFVRPEGESGNGRLVLSAFWAAGAGYLVHLMFGISVPGSSFLLWVIMAALMSPNARTVEVAAPEWGKIAAVTLIGVAALLSIGNLAYLRADYHYLRTRLGQEYAQRLADAETAVRLNPYNDMYRSGVGTAHSDAMSGLLRQAYAEEQAGQDSSQSVAGAQVAFERAVDSLEDTIWFVPLEYDNYLFIANVYNLAGEAFDPRYYQDAIEWSRKGVEVSEFGPGIRYQLAVALQGSGDLQGAEEELLFAIEMDPRYVEPRILLADIYLREGEVDAALEQFERVRELDPEYPGIDDLIDSAAGTSAP